MDGQYTAQFQAELRDLMQWRRDVRHFRRDVVEAAVMDRCLDAFRLAPSVGLSEPWRVIRDGRPLRSASMRSTSDDSRLWCCENSM